MKFQFLVMIAVLMLTACSDPNEARIQEIVQDVNQIGLSMSGDAEVSNGARDDPFFRKEMSSRCKSETTLALGKEPPYKIVMFQSGSCQFATKRFDRGSVTPYETENEDRREHYTCEINLMDVNFDYEFADIDIFQCEGNSSCARKFGRDDYSGNFDFSRDHCAWNITGFDKTKARRVYSLLVELHSVAQKK